MKHGKILTLLISICLVLSLAAIPFMSACEEEEGPPGEQEEEEEEEEEAKTLEIGMLESLTGFGSQGAILHWEGAQIFEEWINEKGGITIDGQQYLIKIVVEDIKGTADGAVAAVNKLVYDHNLKFIVGDSMPFTLAAIGTVTEPAKVLHLNEYNVALPTEYGPNFPYTFVGHNGTLEYCNGLANYVGREYPEVETAVLIHPDDGGIPYVCPPVIQYFEDIGVTVLGDTIGWPNETVDFTPIVDKALGRNPDALLVIDGWPAANGAMLKAARESGFDGLVVINAPCEDVGMVAGPAASTNFLGVGPVVGDPSNTDLMVEWTQMIEEKFGYCYWYNLWGAESVYLMVQAIEAAQSLDPAVVRDYWEQMDSMDSIYGTVYVGGLETYGINHTLYHAVGIQATMDNVIEFKEWIDIVVP